MASEALKKEYILDLADFLIKHGVDAHNAYKLSEEFWEKNWKKLEEVLKRG